ncbi:MAG: AE-binding protein [Lachnospiraceae bacterium]|nr:AE-binding protein [Lachnospiraceae bacterium]
MADNPYGDGDIPAEDTNPYYKNVEPLPESSRPRRDGPGGN